MEEKKKKVVNTIITRDTAEFSQMTDNVYETVALLTKRADQIAANELREIHNKIDEFTAGSDPTDDFLENHERIEMVRHFEQMPKPTLTATEEYLENKLRYRNPFKESKETPHTAEAAKDNATATEKETQE